MKPVADCVCHHCASAHRLQGPWEFGDDTNIPEGQGVRTDLEAVKRAIDEGASEAQLWEKYFGQSVRYMKAFREYKRFKVLKRHWEMEVIVCIGDTGTGKTRWAFENYPDLYSLPPKGTQTWWSGYDGQSTVLVDECYGNRFSYGFLLMLTDRYPLQVPIHGSQVHFTSRTLIFCSNAHPDQWYPKVYEKSPFQNGPLHRRMTQGISRIISFVENEHFVDEGYNVDLIRPINQ